MTLKPVALASSPRLLDNPNIKDPLISYNEKFHVSKTLYTSTIRDKNHQLFSEFAAGALKNI